MNTVLKDFFKEMGALVKKGTFPVWVICWNILISSSFKALTLILE